MKELEMGEIYEHMTIHKFETIDFSHADAVNLNDKFGKVHDPDYIPKEMTLEFDDWGEPIVHFDGL